MRQKNIQLLSFKPMPKLAFRTLYTLEQNLDKGRKESAPKGEEVGLSIPATINDGSLCPQEDKNEKISYL